VLAPDVRQDQAQEEPRPHLLRLRHQPRKRQAEPWYSDHLANILVNDEQILPLVNEFFAQRIFGANRRAYLADRIVAVPLTSNGSQDTPPLG
jgi:hypothetical protein